MILILWIIIMIFYFSRHCFFYCFAGGKTASIIHSTYAAPLHKVDMLSWGFPKLSFDVEKNDLKSIHMVVVSNIFYFHPEPWGNDPIWRAYFSDGLVQPPTRSSNRSTCNLVEHLNLFWVWSLGWVGRVMILLGENLEKIEVLCEDKMPNELFIANTIYIY